MLFVRIPTVAGCHSQGRTIAQARERIREALGLDDDHAETATILDDVRLPPKVKTDLEALQAERAELAALVAKVTGNLTDAARLLTKKQGLSLSDAGELLGLSKQRIQQILQAAS
jgi:predicted RNase H-like HicB family nuclease